MVNSYKRVIESLLLYRRRSLPLRFPSRSGGNIFSSPLTQAAAAAYSSSSSSIPPQNPTTAAGFSNLRGSSDIKPRLLLPSNYRGFAHNPYYVIGINNNRSNHHLPLLLHQERIINNRGGLGGWCSSTTSSRCLFSKASSSDAKLKKIVVDKPLSVIRSAFVRYRGAVCLQIEAFWKRNYMVLLGAGAFGLCLLLWRIMFGIADTFIGFSEGMAKYGFLALSSAIVAFLGLYVRSRFTINPDKVYRIAMRKLNTSAGILEVMGAPLSGTDLRAYIMSSGGLRLKNFKPMLGGKRCFLIFPIQGSERKGLVSVEVKKKKGQYDMKLLAVDVPMTTGPDQRFFLIGDEEEYKVGGGLISELRDPIVKAMAAAKEFEALDQKEEEEDEEREQKEAERKNREEIEKLEKRN